MRQHISFPLYAEALSAYAGWEDLRQELRELGCDGIEAIWAGESIPVDIPKDLVGGYHLTFFPDWLDFYREDAAALLRKFGSIKAVRQFYGGLGAEHLVKVYREDLRRACSLGAKYVVFHVSDVSIEEGYTYHWLHSDREVLESAVEIIRALLPEIPAEMEFLVENQWWPGFTFTRPEETAWLLEQIPHPKRGIMLDTGHLMNTNIHIRSQRDGIAFIREMLRRHGSLSRYIRGVHWHQSVSGAYTAANTGCLPETLPTEYEARFAASYSHILQIDRHQPWTEPEAAALLEEIAPEYLTHELSATDRMNRKQAVCRQMAAVREGREQLHGSGI